MPYACKFPLGRPPTKNKQFSTELIKPVDKMLEHLSSEADLKNGYNLADILTKTSFVFGNQKIYQQFVTGTQSFRDKKSEVDNINDIQKQVKEDLNKFSTRFRLTNLKSEHTINIKQLVYRNTTIFISALARKHSISSNSCFDIIDEMANNNQITQNTAEKLKLAIAFGCEMRLRVYVSNACQCDDAFDLTLVGIKNFLNIVGVASTVNFFQFAYCLQCEVAKQLHFTKLHFYSDSQLISITIGLAFGIKNLTSFSINPHKRFWDSSKFDFDACIDQLETGANLNAMTFKSFKNKIFGKVMILCEKDIALTLSQTKLNYLQMKCIAENLKSAKIFNEASEFYKQMLEIYTELPKGNNRNHKVEEIKYQNRILFSFFE